MGHKITSLTVVSFDQVLFAWDTIKVETIFGITDPIKYFESMVIFHQQNRINLTC